MRIEREEEDGIKARPFARAMTRICARARTRRDARAGKVGRATFDQLFVNDLSDRDTTRRVS